MPTMEELVLKEVKHILGHEPTQLEIQSCSEYLAASEIKWLVDVELAILNWKKEKLVECQWCGDRYLESEMICTDSGQFFCCDQCLKDYQEEHGAQ